jgi:hypothetical protein
MDFPATSRRQFLAAAGAGFGMTALKGMLQEDGLLAGTRSSSATRMSHFAPKAKSVIFLFMYGGPSQVDTFDPKPALNKWANKDIPVYNKDDAFFVGETKATAFPSPWKFKKHGECGLDVSSLLPNLATCADDLCVIRSMHCESNNHAPAIFQMNSGFLQSGYPTMGSWVSYGLGSANRNLPSYVVLLDHQGAPVNGALNWSAGFLPAAYQAVPFRSSGSPILHLGLPKGVSPAQQRARLDMIHKLNQQHLDANPGELELAARIESYELAYRMQMHAPDVVDLSKESKTTLENYGVDRKPTAHFGRNCLLARRLVERGVRFVQLYSGGDRGPSAWDAHKDLKTNHTRQCGESDQPITALLRDLKMRGLLETTLVVWAGEFGRLPTHQGTKGRDHNPHGFTAWMAGGGVKPGLIYGATDEFGYAAADKPVHVHDLHATMLNQLGFDHEKLTYKHLGRNFRLTDVAGNVVNDLLL